MHPVDRLVNVAAGRGRGLITRPQILSFGGDDGYIETRVARGQLVPVHAGVYAVGVRDLDWEQRLLAAVRAAGPDAAASHRAALVVRSLDGIASAPVELVVPYRDGPVPTGALVHRSRRIEPIDIVRGIPVTGVERTLLEVGTCVPAIVVEKAYASAVRRGLTTRTAVERYLREHAGKGRRGTRLLREVIANYHDRVPGSPAEVEMAVLLRRLREAGIEDAVFQYSLALPDGTVATLDLAWPFRRKGLEVDGLDAHGTGTALDYDLERQNLIFDAGFELRRFSVPRFRREPDRVFRQVHRFLCGSSRSYS